MQFIQQDKSLLIDKLSKGSTVTVGTDSCKWLVTYKMFCDKTFNFFEITSSFANKDKLNF